MCPRVFRPRVSFGGNVYVATQTVAQKGLIANLLKSLWGLISVCLNWTFKKKGPMYSRTLGYVRSGLCTFWVMNSGNQEAQPGTRARCAEAFCAVCACAKHYFQVFRVLIQVAYFSGYEL